MLLLGMFIIRDTVMYVLFSQLKYVFLYSSVDRPI